MVGWVALEIAAHAVDVPPFDPDQHVVVVPADPAFRTVAVSEAVGRTEHPAYVVVFAQVVDGTVEPGHESETEDAIETVWDTWAADPRFDPAESNLTVLALDDREVRVRAGTRWDAELGLANDALLPLIDRGFLPRAQAGDLDGGLASLVLTLDREVDKRLWAQRTARRVVIGGATGAASAFPLGLGAIALLRSRSARRRYTDALAKRRERLAQAEARWAELGLDVELRDRIVALKLRGPVTKALVEGVTARLDTIRVGLDALRRRLDEIERATAGGRWTTSGWTAGLAALDAPIDHDTGPGTGLFEPDRRTVQIAPAAFDEALDAEWQAARDGWDRVLDAVDASMRTARDDLSTADLDRMREALVAAGLPTGWVDEHPLAADPEGAWARLDTLRREDPVAYLDAVEDAIERDDALERRVAALIGSRDAARTARAEAEAVDVTGLDTVTVGDDDAEALRARVDEDLASLEAALAAPGDAEAVIALAVGATEGAERLLDLRRDIAAAVRDGARRVAEAGAAVASLDAALRGSRERLAEALRHHSAANLVDATRELREAGEDHEQAHQALAEARTALERREHLAAVRGAERALQERRDALADLDELVGAVARADADRERALALWASVAEIRTRHAREANATDLAPGDALVERLRAEWHAPGDWTLRLAMLNQALEAWHAGERAAQSRERTRRAAEARRVSSIAQSRSTFSSGRSSGSSYRSSSSSSSRSSSSRSAGRSFSSSGRSAGRKF